MRFSPLHSFAMKAAAVFFVAIVAGGGILGTAFYALGAGLTSTDIALSAAEAGSVVTATATFTTINSIPANGKIKVTFGSGFNVSSASDATCSSMDGTFATSVSGQTVTITRQNDGTPQDAAAETCTVNNIVNPSVAGSTGVYIIQTTDAADGVIDADAGVTFDGILAAQLLSTNVQPASLVQSTTNTITITFTTRNALESDGKIKVIFPVGFNVSGASSATCSTMDGSFTTNVNNQTVAIVRSRGSVLAPGAQSCTISNITNPASTGSAGTYTIQTTTSTNQIHDVDGSVTADTITSSGDGGTLTSTNVQPASLTAGIESTATISFTTATTIPANGKIKVTFPTDFDVSGASSATCSTMDGTFVTSVSGQTVTIARQNDGTQQATAAESCTINNVINPSAAGATGNYTIQTADNANSVLDTDAAVASDTLVAAALASTNVEPAALTTGTSNVVTTIFTMVNGLESDGKINVTFPAGFDVSGASGGACSSMDGTFATSVSGQTVTIERSGGSFEPPGPQACTLNNIINPSVAGAGGTYTMQTTTSTNLAHDIDTSVTADTFTPSLLTSVDVQPASTYAGAFGQVSVNFTTVNALADNDLIAVTFPARFNVTGATAGTCSSMNGAFATSVSGQVVTLTRSGGTSVAAGPQTCTIGGIRNPSVAGLGGQYAIATIVGGGGGGLRDRNGGVETDVIAAAPLANANVEPIIRRTNFRGQININFTTSNALESDGKINVTFPAGFDVSGATSGTCSGMDGAFATQVNGQIVTLVRSGGTQASEGLQTCSIGNVVTPVTPGLGGLYTVTTTDSNDALHDVDTSIAGDVFLTSSTNTVSGSLESSEATTKIAVTSPSSGAAFSEGDLVRISWNTSGSDVNPSFVNLWYSMDGGTYWTQIISNSANDGEFGWAAPAGDSAKVIIKVEASDLVSILASDTSDTFTLGAGDIASVVPEEEETPEEDAQASGEEESEEIAAGSFVRGASSSNVYYIETDGTKHVFPDKQTFFTYAESFDIVETISEEELAAYPEGDPMSPKAGSVLVKVKTDKKVYAIEGIESFLRLRWISSEAVATAVYGPHWSDHVIDILADVWSRLTIGEDITSTEDAPEQTEEPFYTRDELNAK